MIFLKKLVLYGAAVALITVAVNAAYMKKDGTWGAADRYRSVPEHIQICNFGSSHGEVSFDYTELREKGYTCFKFSGGRQLPTYDARILKHYIDHLEPGGTAILVMSYISIYGRPEREWDEFESYNNTYYRILPNDLVMDYDPKIDFYVSYAPSLRAGFDLFRVLSWKEEPVSPAATDGYAGNGVDPQVVKDTAYSRYQGYIEQHRGIVYEEAVDAFYEMITLLKERGVTPVMVTTPVMSEFSACIHNEDPAFFDDWYAQIDRICEDTGVSYYDYSEDPAFIYDYSLFSDVDHMNGAGAKKFTRMIAEEVLGIDP